MIVVAIEAEGVGQTVGPFATVEDAQTWIEDQWGEPWETVIQRANEDPLIPVSIRIIESPEAEDSVGLVAP